MSFYVNLVLVTLLFFCCFLYITINSTGGDIKAKYSALLIIELLIGSGLFYMIYSTNLGKVRFLLLFVEFMSLIYISIKMFSKNIVITNRHVFFLIIFFILIRLIPILYLGSSWHVDEWDHLGRGYLLSKNVPLSKIVGNDYYKLPVVPVLVSNVILMTNIGAELSGIILEQVFRSVFIIFFYLCGIKLIKNKKAIILSLLITQYTPRLLHSQEVTPFGFSLILAPIILFLLLKYVFTQSNYYSVNKMGLLLIIILWTVLVLSHPSFIIGLIFYTSLFYIFTIVTKIRIDGTNHVRGALIFGRKINVVLRLLSVQTLIYWTFVGIISKFLLSKGGQFYSDISLGIQLKTTETSMYIPLTSASNPIYTIGWAFIVSLSTSYFIYLIMFKRANIFVYNHLLFLSYYLPGIMLLSLSFLGLLFDPSSNLDRYLGSPAYFLISVSTLFSLSYIIKNNTKKTVYLFVFILCLYFVTGITQPNIAIDLHSEIYEPRSYESMSFSNSFLFNAPDKLNLIFSKDFSLPIDQSLFNIKTSLQPYDLSFKVIRYNLQLIDQGLVPMDNYEYYFFVNLQYYPNFMKIAHNGANILLSQGGMIVCFPK
jgi:hypothetical protein